MRKVRKIKDAVDILHRRYVKSEPTMLAMVEQERVNAEIAHRVFDLRREAGLTQRQLAQRVGTTASVICRLEDADYNGHSLNMLMRIAAAVGKRVRIEFTAARRKRAS